MGRPTKYTDDMPDRVVELGKQGKSPAQIACALGVSRSVLYKWADEREEFMTALTRAKDFEQAHWEDLGHNALFADKFQAAVWKKSMEARFREDYTDRQKHEHTGGPVVFEMKMGDGLEKD